MDHEIYGLAYCNWLQQFRHDTQELQGGIEKNGVMKSSLNFTDTTLYKQLSFGKIKCQERNNN
jgi:hypothetical protein